MFQNQQLIFWTAIVLICIIPSLCYYWARIRKAEIDADLKRMMIEQGRPADEIERVLRASTSSKPDKPPSE